MATTPAGPASPAYPVSVDGEPDPRLSRWLWLIKWLLAIPHYIVLAVLWIIFILLTMIAFFTILFNVWVLRWSWQVGYYSYSALGTDRYPPFSLQPTDYPATLQVEYPQRLFRGLVLIKGWLLAIPHYLVVAIFHGGIGLRYGGGLNALLALFAGIVLLLTGRYPRDIFELNLGMNRWSYRVVAYAALMRDECPPFRLSP